VAEHLEIDRVYYEILQAAVSALANIHYLIKDKMPQDYEVVMAFNIEKCKYILEQIEIVNESPPLAGSISNRKERSAIEGT
jgi:hypothetical protein